MPVEIHPEEVRILQSLVKYLEENPVGLAVVSFDSSGKLVKDVERPDGLRKLIMDSHQIMINLECRM